METLAKRLSFAMERAGLNQPQLAKRASSRGKPMSQQAIQHLLSGRNLTSKHLPAIAEALGISLEWLTTGKGDRVPMRIEPVLVGKIGAGAEIHRFDQVEVLEGVSVHPREMATNVAVIEGDSQYPLQAGWRVWYGPENQGVSEGCIGKLCAVKVKDGPVFLKTLKQGSRKGLLWRLESWNAPPREDVKIEWAARVTDIEPR